MRTVSVGTSQKTACTEREENHCGLFSEMVAQQHGFDQQCANLKDVSLKCKNEVGHDAKADSPSD